MSQIRGTKLNWVGRDQREVFEERRKIALGNEIRCAAGAEGGVQNAAAHHVAHRHEVQA